MVEAMNIEPSQTTPDRTPITGIAARAARFRALGDEHRLTIVDALRWSDRTPGELAAVTGLGTNLVAFHLGVLEEAGLVHRTTSQGDARRRYVQLAPTALDHLWSDPAPAAEQVVFLCTHNAARSQLAAALWTRATGRPACSAGTRPADEVHPLAVRTAARHGLDLSGARPRGYREVTVEPDLVVSVCDRARESAPVFAAPALHWSVPDPLTGGPEAFEAAFDLLAVRVQRLAADVTPPRARTTSTPATSGPATSTAPASTTSAPLISAPPISTRAASASPTSAPSTP